MNFYETQLRRCKTFDINPSGNSYRQLKDRTEDLLRASQDADGSSCSNLVATGREAFLELFNIFGNCVLEKAQNTGKDVRELVVTITGLMRILPEKVQEMVQCTKESSVFSCILQVRMRCVCL